MSEIEAARAYFRRHGWLTEVPATFREALLDRCVLQSVPRGGVLYRLGDAPDGLHGVISGSFAIEMAPHERGPHLTHVFHSGTWIGASAILKGRPRIATPVATRPCRCLYLSGSDFRALVASNPEAWRWLALIVVAELEIAVGALDDVTIRSAGLRVAAILLRLAGVRVDDLPGEPEPELDLTQLDLAHLANLGRATVGEQLDRLAASGLIVHRYGKIRLVDPVRLRELLERAP